MIRQYIRKYKFYNKDVTWLHKSDYSLEYER